MQLRIGHTLVLGLALIAGLTTTINDADAFGGSALHNQEDVKFGAVELTKPPEEGEMFCMAKAMYHEARGEGRKGLEAVGAVIVNRLENGKFPDSICDVVHEGGFKPGCQFSFYCDDIGDTPTNQKAWEFAQKVAAEVIAERVKDRTRGALFYHATYVKAAWHKTRPRTTKIGKHIFYR